MKNWVLRADRRFMRRSERHRTPWRDELYTGASHVANRSLLWFVIAALLATWGGDRGRRAAVRGAVAIALASAIANGPVKLLVRRARPRRPVALVRRPRTSSFPSGHTASAFAFAVAASREMPPAAALVLPLAATVGYSRVYVGVHYPSDVLLGAALGTGTGLVAGGILRVLGYDGTGSAQRAPAHPLGDGPVTRSG